MRGNGAPRVLSVYQPKGENGHISSDRILLSFVSPLTHCHLYSPSIHSNPDTPRVRTVGGTSGLFKYMDMDMWNGWGE